MLPAPRSHAAPAAVGQPAIRAVIDGGMFEAHPSPASALQERLRAQAARQPEDGLSLRVRAAIILAASGALWLAIAGMAALIL